jgi:hypothetical protein
MPRQARVDAGSGLVDSCKPPWGGQFDSWAGPRSVAEYLRFAVNQYWSLAHQVIGVGFNCRLAGTQVALDTRDKTAVAIRREKRRLTYSYIGI